MGTALFVDAGVVKLPQGGPSNKRLYEIKGVYFMIWNRITNVPTLSHTLSEFKDRIE